MIRKQIAFDVDTKVTKQILGKNYTNIYNTIRSHMEKNSFVHLQGSVYVSVSAISNSKVTAILNDLIKHNNYIAKCIRDIRKTDITREHSLNHLFDYDGTPGKYAKLKKQKVSNIATRNKKAKKKGTKTR